MATPNTADLRNCNGHTPITRSQPAICLADWWLAKTEVLGTTLAVAGHTDTVAGTQPTRFCSSLPILKRHDVFNLETTDGKSVILKGFMNRARTEENGFPSQVCNHFMFGFPQYWKECTERYMVKEPPSDILPPKSNSVISDSEKKSNVSFTASGSKESHHGDSIVEDCMTMKSLITLNSGEKNNVLDGVDKIIEDSQAHDSPLKAKFGSGMNSSVEIPSHTKSKARTRSMIKLEMKQKNGQASVVLSGGEKIGLNSVSMSLDYDKLELVCGESNLGGKNNLHVVDTLLKGSNGNINSSELVDAGSVEQIPETSNLENGLKRVQTGGVKQKAKCKAATPLSKPITADDENCTAVFDSVEHIPETSNLEIGLKRVQTRGVKQKAKKAATPLGKPVTADDESCTAVSDSVKEIPETSNMENGLKRVQTRGVKQKAKSKAATPLSKPATADDENCMAVSDSVEQIPETSNLENGLERVQTRGVKQKAKKAATPLSKPVTADDENCTDVSDSVKEIPETSNLESGLKRDQTRGVKQKAKGKAATPLSKPVTADDENCMVVSDSVQQIPETSNLENGLKRVQIRGVKQKAKSKAASPLSKRVADDENRTAVSDRISLSENAKAPYTRRKLEYETPKREKKKAQVDSPQSSSFKRSRSGRLLMPKLNFWRNQRAISNADGTVIGIKEDN